MSGVSIERPAGSVVGAAFGSHEPAGMALVSDRTFASLTEDSWSATQRAGTYQLATDATAPDDPATVGEMFYAAGYPSSGQEPGVSTRALPGGTTRVYLAFRVIFSADWQGHDSGVNKIWHLWVGGLNRLVIAGTGIGAGALVPQFRTQQTPVGEENLSPNVAGQEGAVFVRGQWHLVEIDVTGNTFTGGSPNSDGVLRLWLDGVLTHDYTDRQLTTEAQGREWTQVQWGPTWGGAGGATVAADQYQRISRIYVSAGS